MDNAKDIKQAKINRPPAKKRRKLLRTREIRACVGNGAWSGGGSRPIHFGHAGSSTYTDKQGCEVAS